MSFFGFEERNDLESERRKFLEGGLSGAHQEDVAVYTWGEDSYDGLGDALQEGGDELNDETFGGTGQIGKDFDFSSSALPGHDRSFPSEPVTSQEGSQPSAAFQGEYSRSQHTLESVWDDKSPFSVLPRMNGSSRTSDHPIGQSSSKFSPFGTATAQESSAHRPATLNLGADLHRGVHTLEEIEKEMLAAAATQQQQVHSQTLLQSPLRAQAQRQVVSPQHAATPPPRMHPHSQSPRFHQQQQQHQIHLLQIQQQQQRQLLELQEQRERQQRQQLLELQEQLKMEELERQQQQLRMQHAQAGVPSQLHNHLLHQRLTSGGLSPALGDRAPRRMGRQSPAVTNPQFQLDVPFQGNLQYHPQDIQLQQRLLAEMAQAEFLSNMQVLPQSDRDAREEREMQELLRVEAMRKIMEAERMEEKRKRKLAKIAHMSRYNDLMTQSDKDFITRIQVSQLVTQDPYADDFYAQVYGAILRSRLGLQTPEDRVLKFGSGGGVGLGLAPKGPGRRQSAMQRMEAQVERIVNNARLREKEKITLNSLQGALGRTSGRSYKAAPRQLLQVDAGGSPTLSHAHAAHISKSDATLLADREQAAKEAAKISREALGTAGYATGVVHKKPLTQREVLVRLEHLYDVVLELEQRRRDQPSPEEEEASKAWQEDYDELVEELWKGIEVGAAVTDNHPFISLLTPIKGKRLLPRIIRHFDPTRTLNTISFLLICFSKLDVVRLAPMLDTLEETRETQDLENQTQAFIGSVVQSLLPVVAKMELRYLTALLELLLDHNAIEMVAQTRPGIAILTLLMSRVEVIKQGVANGTDVDDIPTIFEAEQWRNSFDRAFTHLTPHLLTLFPSVRLSTALGILHVNVPNSDEMDQPVWQFLAALALNATVEQHHVLVTILRELVLENVATANKGWGADTEEARRMRLANANIFLHALGLDSSQIAL